MNNIDTLLLRRLDLNNLVALHTLLSTRSVSLSANQLCLGQPAVSHILKRLRELLGDELLCRYGREMTLTPLAESLREPLARWLAEGLQLFQTSDRFEPLSVHTVFRLAMPDLLEVAYLPALIGRLRQDAPGITLEVEAMPAHDVDAAFEQGRIDAAVGYFPDLPPRLCRQALLQSALVCIYNPQLIDMPDPICLPDLAQPVHIHTSYAGNGLNLIDLQLRAHGLVRHVIAATASLLAIPAILEQVPAVAVLPDFISGVVRHPGSRLRFCPIQDALVTIPIELVWHPRFTLDKLHAYMRGKVSEAFMPTKVN